MGIVRCKAFVIYLAIIKKGKARTNGTFIKL
jgi:hypothetical protein